MKFLKLAVISCTILIALASCSKPQKAILSDEEQATLEDEIITQLDSIALQLCEISTNPQLQALFNADSLQISEEQLLVKPEYLLKESDLNELVDLSQKYRARAIAMADEHIRKMYQLFGESGYYAAIQNLQLEINDAALQKIVEQGVAAVFSPETYRSFYEEMKAANRIEYFYDVAAALTVESIYLISNNIDLYNIRLTDDASAALSQNLQNCMQAVALLAPSRPQMRSLLLALKPLNKINATTSEELKQQLSILSTQITVIRKAMILDKE